MALNDIYLPQYNVSLSFFKFRTFRFCSKAWFVEFTLTLQIDSSILDWIINYNQSIMPRKKSVTPKLVLLDIQK